jgi:iron complex outermembrane receptor protein
MTKRTGMLFCAASVLGLWAGSAVAQEAGTGGNPLVVVTAQKRSENIQKVPVAITAFTSEKRDVVGIQSIQDMTNFTPGLGYSTETDRITLRGVGRTTNVLSADAPVANYDDGLYETFAVAAGRSSLDLDRVEILRGPQGTLAGRNAEAGAINEITIHPSSTPQAEIRATYGNYNHTTLEGAVTGPIAPGWSARAYGVWDYQTQPWVKNIVPGARDGGEGNVINEWYTDIQVQGKISDKLDMWTKFQSAGWWNGAGAPGAQAEGWTNSGFPTAEFVSGSAFLFANTMYACNAGSGATNVVNTSPAGCNNPAFNNPWKEAKSQEYLVRLPSYFSINTQWTWHANGFDIKYIGGGTYYHYMLTGGVPNRVAGPITSETLPTTHLGTCFPAACPGLNINNKYSFLYQELNGFWSDEIDFISTGNGPIQWVTGLYQFYQHYHQPVYVHDIFQPQLNTPSCLTAFPCPHQTNFRYFDNQPIVSDESYAVFGQIDWKATDTLKVTLGARYSTDRKFGSESVRLLDFGQPLAAFGLKPEIFGKFLPAFDLTELCSVVDCAPGKGISSKTTYSPLTGLAKRNYDASWSGPSGTAGLEWTPDSSTLFYAKYGRGYKSGGFNIGIFTVLSFTPWTDKESVDSFEVGMKKTFFHALTVNAAAYYYSYTNLQIPISIAQTAGGLTQSETSFYNVPKSISDGIELELNWTPIENLNLYASYSFDNTQITQGMAADAADPNAQAAGAKPLFSPAVCAAQIVTPGGVPGGCTADIYSVGIAGDPYAGMNVPQSLKGNYLPNAPRNKLAINVTYTWDLGGGMGKLIPSVSYVWRDVTYGSLFTRSYNAAPAWDQWDARATLKSSNGKIEAILFFKNIGNKLGYDQGSDGARLNSVTNVIGPGGAVTTFNYIQGVNGPAGFNGHVQGENSLGIVKSSYPTPPFTFGLEVHYKFF